MGVKKGGEAANPDNQGKSRDSIYKLSYCKAPSLRGMTREVYFLFIDRSELMFYYCRDQS